MPRHRRSRRASFRPSARFARAVAFAAFAAFALPALSPASPGTPQPAAARVPPTSMSSSPSGAAGAVAGVAGSMRADTPRDRRAVRLVVAPTEPSRLRDYRWPVAHPRITLPFGPWRTASRIVDGQAFHDGMDLATFCGDRVVAAHDGVVLAAGRHYDSQMGWIGDLKPYFDRVDAKSLWTTLPIVVVIDDGNGYRSLYAHFGRIVVKRGDTVRAGQLLGFEGRTGHASGCHLHYGLFSPLETKAFAIDPAVARHMKLPLWEIARIDPFLVLPARGTLSGTPESGATAGGNGIE
ncbi:MAG: M23 family metallopeptidase [Chloroflexi bacterium]|nr:M23 family metallopeptidase [Chloroflexota bacterium]